MSKRQKMESKRQPSYPRARLRPKSPSIQTPAFPSPNQTHINHLPNELLSSIFVLAQPETDGSYEGLAKPPTALLGVCRRWQGVAKGLPELWCRFVVKGSSESVAHDNTKHYAKRLARSKNHPLTLSFPPGSINLMDAGILKSIFEDNIHRWEDVHYCLDVASAPKLLSAISSAPKLLKRLDVVGSDVWVLTSLLGSLPNLAYLKLAEGGEQTLELTDPAEYPALMTSLKELHYGGISTSTTCLALLDRCPGVEVVHFSDDYDSTGFLEPILLIQSPPDNIALHNLWSLTFAQHPLDVFGHVFHFGTKVLDSLVLPSLRFLVMGPISISISNRDIFSQIQEMSIDHSGIAVETRLFDSGSFRRLLRLNCFDEVTSLTVKSCPREVVRELVWVFGDPIFPYLSSLTLQDCGTSMDWVISKLIALRSHLHPVSIQPDATLQKFVVVFSTERGRKAVETELKSLQNRGLGISWETRLRDDIDECIVVSIG
ncbi:hypothetical protein DXG01_011541 [Tephrocybe rancida]|nr:hypothetical protein DXG01_011541 [Tephrocybe rancida]